LKRVPKLGNLLTRQDDARAEALALKKAVKISMLLRNFCTYLNE
jgi:hypothetical protein